MGGICSEKSRNFPFIQIFGPSSQGFGSFGLICVFARHAARKKKITWYRQSSVAWTRGCWLKAIKTNPVQVLTAIFLHTGLDTWRGCNKNRHSTKSLRSLYFNPIFTKVLLFIFKMVAIYFRRLCRGYKLMERQCRFIILGY